VAVGADDEEGAGDGDEEHEVSEEAEEEAYADLGETLTGAATALRAVGPVVAVAVAAGALVDGWVRRTAAVAVAFVDVVGRLAAVDLRWCEDGGHKSRE